MLLEQFHQSSETYLGVFVGTPLCFISDCPWLPTLRPCTRGSGTRPTMWCLQVREQSFHGNLRQFVSTEVKRREYLLNKSRLLRIQVFLVANSHSSNSSSWSVCLLVTSCVTTFSFCTLSKTFTFIQMYDQRVWFGMVDPHGTVI